MGRNSSKQKAISDNSVASYYSITSINYERSASVDTRTYSHSKREDSIEDENRGFSCFVMCMSQKRVWNFWLFSLFYLASMFFVEILERPFSERVSWTRKVLQMGWSCHKSFEIIRFENFRWHISAGNRSDCWGALRFQIDRYNNEHHWFLNKKRRPNMPALFIPFF